MDRTFLNKQFWKYVIPSMFSMLLTGFYAIVDGLFVGNAVGDEALAAINLVWPIQALVSAAAIGVGIGSAVLMSQLRGQEKGEEANRAAGIGIVLLMLIGVILPILLLLFLPQLLNFLGAEGALYAHCKDYIVIVLIGAIAQVLGAGLNPLIRNHGKTIVATLIMSSGMFTNIILDYVFVFRFNMGLFGAGFATILAQIVVSIVSLCYLCRSNPALRQRSTYRPQGQMIKQILTIAISPFGQTFVPSIVILLTNWKCIAYGGNEAVTMFSVVSYVLSSVQYLLTGIGDGTQPLFSYYHGCKKPQEKQYLFHKAMCLSMLVSFGLSALVIVFATPLTNLFGISAGIQEACSMAVIITAISFPCFSVVRLISANFYACEQVSRSSILVYVEPCLVLPGCLMILPILFGLQGVWYAYPVAQGILCILALGLRYQHVQKQCSVESEMAIDG